jgi:hypothetical protein
MDSTDQMALLAGYTTGATNKQTVLARVCMALTTISTSSGNCIAWMNATALCRETGSTPIPPLYRAHQPSSMIVAALPFGSGTEPDHTLLVGISFPLTDVVWLKEVSGVASNIQVEDSGNNAYIAFLHGNKTVLQAFNATTGNVVFAANVPHAIALLSISLPPTMLYSISKDSSTTSCWNASLQQQWVYQPPSSVSSAPPIAAIPPVLSGDSNQVLAYNGTVAAILAASNGGVSTAFQVEDRISAVSLIGREGEGTVYIVSGPLLSLFSIANGAMLANWSLPPATATSTAAQITRVIAIPDPSNGYTQIYILSCASPASSSQSTTSNNAGTTAVLWFLTFDGASITPVTSTTLHSEPTCVSIADSSDGVSVLASTHVHTTDTGGILHLSSTQISMVVPQ